MTSATRKETQPDWFLEPEWGIKRDPLNWILMYRPEGKKTWQRRTYYPTLRQLLESYCRKVERTSPAVPVLYDHIDAAAHRVTEAIDRLTRCMGADQK